MLSTMLSWLDFSPVWAPIPQRIVHSVRQNDSISGVRSSTECGVTAARPHRRLREPLRAARFGIYLDFLALPLASHPSIPHPLSHRSLDDPQCHQGSQWRIRRYVSPPVSPLRVDESTQRLHTNTRPRMTRHRTPHPTLGNSCSSFNRWSDRFHPLPVACK